MTTRCIAFFAVLCLVTACGAGGYGSTSTSPITSNTQPTADQVNATASLAFDPPTLTTKVGHEVTFAFASVGHNVFFDAATGAPANIPGVNANTSVTRTFDTAGTFTYTCHIHPDMHGKVVVQ